MLAKFQANLAVNHLMIQRLLFLLMDLQRQRQSYMMRNQSGRVGFSCFFGFWVFCSF